MAHLQSTLGKDGGGAFGKLICMHPGMHTCTLPAQSCSAGLEEVKCWRMLVNELMPGLVMCLSSALVLGCSWEKRSASPQLTCGSPAGGRDRDGRDWHPVWDKLPQDVPAVCWGLCWPLGGVSGTAESLCPGPKAGMGFSQRVILQKFRKLGVIPSRAEPPRHFQCSVC